jgi:hypothetical protein
MITKESESWYFGYYDFCGIDGFDSKVDVAPKSFHILIAFADYDLPAEILRLFWCWPLGFIWSVCWWG